MHFARPVCMAQHKPGFTATSAETYQCSFCANHIPSVQKAVYLADVFHRHGPAGPDVLQVKGARRH